MGTISRTGGISGTALSRGISTAPPSSPSNCDECQYQAEVDDAPWALPTPTDTLLVLIDNSTNITRTSIVQGQVSTFETDVSTISREWGIAQLEETVHL